MDQEPTPGTEPQEEQESTLDVPTGSASYGWVWVVGIIIVVALILFFLQGRVPEAQAPETVVEPDTTEEVAEMPTDGEDEPEEMVEEAEE